MLAFKCRLKNKFLSVLQIIFALENFWFDAFDLIEKDWSWNFGNTQCSLVRIFSYLFHFLTCIKNDDENDHPAAIMRLEIPIFEKPYLQWRTELQF